MTSALVRLREAAESFSPTERAAAHIILSNPQLVAELSIHELAKQTFSSPSTIVRLCNHTGYSGYKEFRRAMINDLAVREQTKKEQVQIVHSDSLDDIIEKITYKNIVALEETKALIDTNVLRQCVDLVQNAKVIYLFGIGASLCAAKDAYLKFLRINKLCVINEDWHSQLLQAKNATKEDLGIAISYSGATAEIVECMKSLKENGTPTIAITRYVKSPVAKLADQRLYTAASESLFRTGAMSSRISQLNIIDILYTALSNRQYEQSMDQLSRTHIHKPNEEERDGNNA